MLEKFLDRFREKGPSRPRTKTETEKTRRLVIVLLIVVAVLASVALVGYGYYSTKVRPWNQRILKVNGTVIDMRTFVYALRLQQGYSQYYSSQAEWAQAVAGSLEQNELARQRLAELGVDVTDVTSSEAVDAKLREQLVSYGFMSDNATESEFQEGRKSFKKALKKIELSLGNYEKLAIEPELISEELQKQIGDVQYPATDNVEHAQVQALLVTGADAATVLRARWEAGEDFDTLADEDSVSESLGHITADNTSIEWVAKGIKSEAFDNYTFREVWSPVVISDPIQDSDSTGSYWLIRVVARESRPLSDSDRETLVGEAYSKWLEEASDPENNDIHNYLEDESGPAKLSWALDHVAVSTS
jgi:flagellar basal body-associated protein FliL